MTGRAPKVDAVRVAMAAQWIALRSWCGELSAKEWEAPSVVSGWRVADLVAHLGLVADSVVVAAVSPTSEKPLTVAGYVARYAEVSDAIDSRTREGGASSQREVIAELDRLGAAAMRAMSSEVLSDDPVVRARRGPIRWSDFLATRCIELAVHSADLDSSLPGRTGPAVEKSCLRVATRALAQVLAERAPGRSVEVRVPPFAAVQCVAGPRHTRGTPAAVVELDPISFLRLATGRLGWTTAVGEGSIKASGQRTDLTEWLPLLA